MSLRRFIAYVVLVVVGFMVGSTLRANSQTDVPSYQPADCMFEIPEGRTVTCGYLTVPAARDREGNALVDAGTMRLAVAVFESDSDNPQPDPVVYLEGGPGGDALETIPLAFEQRFAPFLADRDFIMFDQRGTGYSQPSLACPEYTEWALTTTADERPFEALMADSTRVILECRERLAAEGVDFSNFNSRESAQDLDDLREALGYESWNLFGISYGTRLALTAMRDTPQGIRSVILDSAYPLEANLYADTASNASRAFRILFDECAADAACNAAYPELEAVFQRVYDRLNAEPVAQTITNPLTGESYDTVYNGFAMTGLLFQSLYVTQLIPALPSLIYAIDAGDFALANALNGAFLVDLEFISLAQQVAVQCHEEVALADVIQADPNAPAYVREYFELAPTLGSGVTALCAVWEAGAADAIENEAVISDIPALILAGQYDPITPPAYGVQVSESLENDFYYEFPGIGHGASIAGECPTSITLVFLDDPTTAPDESCIAEMSVTFNVPVSDVAFEPFSSETFGISGVLPEGWSELAPGVYAESATATTALIIQAAPASVDELVSLLGTQLGVEIGDSTGAYESANYSYRLYEFDVQGLSLVLAVSDVNGTVVYALVQTLPSDRDAALENIFTPVLDALTLE